MIGKTSKRRNQILAAASIAALSALAFSRPAMAQFPAQNQAQEQPGHANDANNRLGSGGVNGGRPMNNSAARPMPLIINRAEVLDARNNPSVGIGGAGSIGGTPTGPQPLPGVGLNRDTVLQQQTQAQDANISGMSSNIAAQNINNNLTPGSLDAASMYGMGLHTTYVNGPQSAGVSQPLDNVGAEDPSMLQMRPDLQGSSLNNFGPAGKPAQGAAQSNQPNGQPQPAGLNQPINQVIPAPFDAPANAPLVNNLQGSQISGGPLSPTGMIPTGRGPAAGAAANGQNPLMMKTLQERLAESSNVSRAILNAQGSNKPSAGRAGVPQFKAVAAQGPVQVSNLAVGVKAKGLHDLLAGAEDLVRAGKFDSAIQKYNQAQGMAPNNPLAPLGRAQAELAGGYYARAEQDLRAALHSNPEVLTATFDLKGLFPQDRLDYVRKDLHELAQSDPKSERPWFLLAYLDYNTDAPASATADLDEAAKRSSRDDWAIRLMRQHWSLVAPPKTAVPKPVESPAPLPLPPALPPDFNK